MATPVKRHRGRDAVPPYLTRGCTRGRGCVPSVLPYCRRLPAVGVGQAGVVDEADMGVHGPGGLVAVAAGDGLDDAVVRLGLEFNVTKR